jgi:hypothetical protein
MGKYIDTFGSFTLKENSTPEYDKILDLYNKVGLDGMSKDQIDFLKSGGKTKCPDGLCGSSHPGQKEYDDFVQNKHIDKPPTTEGWQDINDLNKIIDRCGGDVEVTYDYENVGYFLGMLCCLNFIDKKETLDSLKTLNSYGELWLKQEGGKIKYAIPKSWLKHLNLD